MGTMAARAMWPGRPAGEPRARASLSRRLSALGAADRLPNASGVQIGVGRDGCWFHLQPGSFGDEGLWPFVGLFPVISLRVSASDAGQILSASSPSIHTLVFTAFLTSDAPSLAMLSLALTVLAAADNAPHYHRGKLAPYQLGPPSVTLSTSDEQRLRAGRPVMQTVLGGDGESRRLIMVQDVPVPSSVVLGCAPPPWEGLAQQYAILMRI